MRILRTHFTIAADAEITLEANPESVRAPLLAAWRAGMMAASTPKNSAMTIAARMPCHGKA